MLFPDVYCMYCVFPGHVPGLHLSRRGSEAAAGGHQQAGGGEQRGVQGSYTALLCRLGAKVWLY